MTLTAAPGSVPGPEGSRVAAIAQAGAILASTLDGVRFGHLDDTTGGAQQVILGKHGDVL